MTRSSIEHRASTKVDAARALVRALVDDDCDQGEIAEACGVGPSIVQRWCDRNRPETITLADVVLAGVRRPKVGRALLSWAASRLGLVVSERLAARATGDHIAHVARVSRERAELIEAWCAGLGSGAPAFTDAQLARLDRELADEEGAIASLRAWVEQEKSRRAAPPLRAVVG